MVQFVIIGQPRTGTTMTVDMVNSHLKVFADNELFNPWAIIRYRQRVEVEAEILYRNNNPIRFLDEFYNSDFSKEYCAIGFNFMLGHRIEALEYLTDHEEIKIIYIKRDNSLAQFSSWSIALEDKKWATYTEPEEQNKIDFQRSKFENYRGGIDTLSYLFESNFANREMLTLEYTQLLKPETSMRICEYLNVKPQVLTTDLKKQNTRRIISRFTNPRDVKNHLRNIGKYEWLTER